MWVRKIFALTSLALLSGACGGKSVYQEGGEAGAGSMCEGASCGGECVDLSGDARHCGSCGNACGPGASCSGGRCIAQCPGARCGERCVDLGTDPNHCGFCDNQCVGDGVTCIGGACQAACSAGYVYCDGACVDWRSDALNCGGCGNFCPDDSQCLDGICQARCLGSTWCNGLCVDLTSDPENCGSCASRCPMTSQCVMGACVPGKCGDGVVQFPAEEGDPPPGPSSVVPLDPLTCRYDFSRINQWYCHDACGNWGGGPPGCDQLDADEFCKLKMDNPRSKATDWTTTRAMSAPGVCCPPPAYEPGMLGCTPLGTLTSRGVNLTVSVHPTSLFSTHSDGTVITNLVCTDP